MSRISFDTIRMSGGMDDVTPILSTPNGFARNALNFEAVALGGYQRVKGYERFSGQSKPSSAFSYLLFITPFVNVPSVGDVINGVTSLATAVVCHVTGTYIVYTKLLGAFQAGESIKSGALTIGVNSPVQPITLEEKAFNLSTAADLYRLDISPMPGTGPALGGFVYNDVIYAFRANQTNTLLYKSTINGWVNVPFYREASFSAGGASVPADGDTLTQGATTAVIKRVMLESGAWLGSSAAGRFIIDSAGFVSGAATAGTVGVTLDSPDTQIVMIPGGKIEAEVGNFSGGSKGSRVYGADGANRAFEFDGDALAPISTKNSPDTPKHIHVHINMLFLSINEHLFFSAPGLPYDYTALSGAGEYATGYDITGIKTMPGNQTSATLMVTSRAENGVYMLYGKDSATFIFTPYLSGSGALDYTLQNMAQTYMLSDRGIIGLQSSLNFGNFDTTSFSYHINNYIKLHKNQAVASIVDNEASQYKVYFSDGNALHMTILNNKLIGIMPIKYPDSIYQAFSGKLSNGEQVSFLCTGSGHVMQMKKGTSFDGQNINATLTMAYNATRSPRILKRYRKCALEVLGGTYAKINFGYSLGYNKPSITQPLDKTYENKSNPFVWDNFTWDNFTWDGINIAPFEIEMQGIAENVSLSFNSSTSYYDSYIINTAIIHYSLGRSMR